MSASRDDSDDGLLMVAKPRTLVEPMGVAVFAHDVEKRCLVAAPRPS